jgi:hypothetical protein
MFFQTSPQSTFGAQGCGSSTHLPVARLPSELVVGGFQSPDQYYTRQVMLFLAICIIYALTLSIILLTIIIVHERIIYIRHRIFPENPRCQIEILFRHINTPLRGVGSWVYTKYSKYFNTQPMHIITRQCLNIRARPPTRWSGPTYKRKTSAAVRRVKSGIKRGFICGINGIYRDDEPSSSEFSDLNNGSNGNFGI